MRRATSNAIPREAGTMNTIQMQVGLAYVGAYAVIAAMLVFTT